MAALGAAYVTLADIAKQENPDGTIAEIAELLTQTNSMAGHIPWYPTNKDTSHVTTVRTGLPQPSLRRMNEGIAPAKTANAQIEDGVSHLEGRAVLDIDMPAGGNLAKVRMNEMKGHAEGFMQYFQYLLLYGTNQIDERQFNGLAIRYNALTGNVADSVISAGGSGADNSSVWLINWGENTVFGSYPKGTVGGLVHEDKGIEFQPTSVTAGAVGSGYYAYVDRLVWKCGLVVKDWRHVVRIPNIDISGLAAKDSGQATTDATYLIDVLADAIERIPNAEGQSNLHFYCNRRVRSWIRRQSATKASSTITFDAPAGTTQIPIMRVHGVPVTICDQISSAEGDVPNTVSTSWPA